MLEPLHDFAITFAASCVPFKSTLCLVTFLELDDKVAHLGRVVVTMDDDILVLHALKLLIVVLQVIQRVGVRGIENAALV